MTALPYSCGFCVIERSKPFYREENLIYQGLSPVNVSTVNYVIKINRIVLL